MMTTRHPLNTSSRLAVWLVLLVGLASCGTGKSIDGVDDDDDSGTGDSPRICIMGSADGETTVSYAGDIVPIIAAHGCLTTGCHGGGLISSAYNLETYEGIFGPGFGARTLDTCNVVPGDPEASFLIEKLSSDSPRTGVRMPMNGDPLSAEEIELFRTWIAEGAADN